MKSIGPPHSLIALLKEIFSEIKTSSFVKGGVGSFVIKFADLFFKMILGVVLARTLGPENFGIYTFVFAIISILTIPSALGLPQLLVRYIANYEVNAKWGKIKALLKTSSLAVTGVSLIFVFGSFILIYFGVINFDANKISTFYWGLTLLPILAFTTIVSDSIRGLRHITIGLLPKTVIRHLLFIAALLISNWILVNNYVSSEMAMVFNVVSTAFALLVGAFWLFKYLPDSVWSSESDYEFKEWAFVAIPLLLNGGMSVINSRLDVILLGWMGTNEMVGVYEVAWRASTLVSFGLGALNMLLGPYFSRYFNSDQYGKLQKIATVSVLVNFVIGLLATSIFVFFGEFLLGFVFGEEFSVGYQALQILCFAHLITVASGSVAVLLNMVGFEKIVLMGLTISALSNGILNYLLIPIYGMEGAAIASIITFLIWNIYLVTQSIKLINIDTTIFSLIKLARN